MRFARETGLNLRSVGELVLTIKSWVRSLETANRAAQRTYSIHPDWSADFATDLLIGALDLSSAYRLLPVCPDSYDVAVIRIQYPDSTCLFYIMLALPFGARSSVALSNGWARTV
jgi:hypothetical protein